MSTPAIKGPIPPYSNVNVHPAYYQPSNFNISGITLGVTTTVTTSVNHNYSIGNLIRLTIPTQFGSRQLNGQSGYVLSIPATNQFVLSIDSSVNVDQFIAASATTQPQTIPVGDINNGVQNANGRGSVGTYILGSFINISP